MMNPAKNIPLKWVVSGSLGGLVIWIVITQREKKKREITKEIMDKVSQFLDPAGEGLNKEIAFDANLAENLAKTRNLTVIPPPRALYIARQIEETFGSFWSGGDNEFELYGILEQIPSKADISQVAKEYLGEYRVSLKNRFREKLTNSEIRKVLQAVDKPITR